MPPVPLLDRLRGPNERGDGEEIEEILNMPPPGALCLVILTIAAGPAAGKSPFEDALAAWHLSGPEDSVGASSGLQPSGAVRLGVVLDGEAAEASWLRGGDGKAAVLEGGWLDAGQGAAGELNPAGSGLTLLVRLREPSGAWDSTLLSKHGGHGALVYNLFSADLGEGMLLGFELGTDRGMFQVKTPAGRLAPGEWHDVIARYDGRLLELFVDGALHHAIAAGGSLRRENSEACLLGAEPHAGKPSRPFRGEIDHAALWSRALKDEEILFLSGGRPAAERARAHVARERAREEAALREKLARDPHRPRYHFVPPAGWMNDPNGLGFWKDEYHLFYQHNPHGAFWGTMHWGHAVSRDLVRWTHLPMALVPTPGGPDWNGVFSGCMVDAGGVPTIVYTGVSPEVQCLAVSKDGLRTWEKHPGNPVIAGPPAGLKVTGFRDPWVWRGEDGWYMALGSGTRGVGGTVFLYHSPDLERWEYLHPLLQGKRAHGEMWECPCFFPLGDKHVLLVSVHGTVLYFIGTYRDRRFTPEVEGSTDHGGHFYAAQSFADGKGRRLLFGWVTEGRGQREQRAAGWSGAQSLPRVLSLLPDGQLGMEPAEEVLTLRVADRPFLGRTAASPGSGGREVLMESDPAGAAEVGLEVRHGDETIRVGYCPGEERIITYRLDAGKGEARRGLRGGTLKLARGEPLRLRAFVDGSILEVFANGRACLTMRFYPSGPYSADGYALGGSPNRKMESWEIAP